MKRRELILTVLKSLAVGIFAGRPAFADEDLDPVKLMPDTHKVMFENSFVRVVEGRIPAGGAKLSRNIRAMSLCSWRILTPRFEFFPTANGFSCTARLAQPFGARPPSTKFEWEACRHIRFASN